MNLKGYFCERKATGFPFEREREREGASGKCWREKKSMIERTHVAVILPILRASHYQNFAC